MQTLAAAACRLAKPLLDALPSRRASVTRDSGENGYKQAEGVGLVSLQTATAAPPARANVPGARTVAGKTEECGWENICSRCKMRISQRSAMNTEYGHTFVREICILIAF